MLKLEITGSPTLEITGLPTLRYQSSARNACKRGPNITMD